MFSSLTAYGEYSFEVVSEKHDAVIEETEQKDEKKVNMNNVVENYKKVMSNDNDKYIVRNQLAYNHKRKIDINNEINKLEKNLKLLPKIVKKEYREFDRMLKSSDGEMAANTWISFEDAFNNRQDELEDRISILKEDLIIVRTRISELKLKQETMETVSSITNPFVQTSSRDSKEQKEKKVLRAKSNLKKIVKQVTYNETKDLLGDVQYNTIGLCEFSCGRSNCYVCNLFYGKSAK
jgi:vacuolar-type H+-ATPase subunit I/STV1